MGDFHLLDLVVTFFRRQYHSKTYFEESPRQSIASYHKSFYHDVRVSESVMRKHPLLKRINSDTGTSARMDRNGCVCLNDLNPQDPTPRKRCYTFCGDCRSEALMKWPVEIIKKSPVQN